MLIVLPYIVTLAVRCKLRNVCSNRSHTVWVTYSMGPGRRYSRCDLNWQFGSNDLDLTLLLRYGCGLALQYQGDPCMLTQVHFVEQ
jgi:hypothetical protein